MAQNGDAGYNYVTLGSIKYVAELHFGWLGLELRDRISTRECAARGKMDFPGILLKSCLRRADLCGVKGKSGPVAWPRKKGEPFAWVRRAR